MKKGDKETKKKPSEGQHVMSKFKTDRQLKYKKPRKGHMETGKSSN